MPQRLMFDSYTMSVGSGSGLSKDLDMSYLEMKIESCVDILNNWVYHGWEDHTGVIMINIHLALISLANTLPI